MWVVVLLILLALGILLSRRFLDPQTRRNLKILSLILLALLGLAILIAIFR